MDLCRESYILWAQTGKIFPHVSSVQAPSTNALKFNERVDNFQMVVCLQLVYNEIFGAVDSSSLSLTVCVVRPMQLTLYLFPPRYWECLTTENEMEREWNRKWKVYVCRIAWKFWLWRLPFVWLQWFFLPHLKTRVFFPSSSRTSNNLPSLVV